VTVSRQARYEKSVGGLSKNKSQISINKFQKLDDQRAANFNSDLI